MPSNAHKSAKNHQLAQATRDNEGRPHGGRRASVGTVVKVSLTASLKFLRTRRCSVLEDTSGRKIHEGLVRSPFRTTMRTTLLVISLVALVTNVLSQTLPTQGIQLGISSDLDAAIFPLNVYQCEPVLIFYNITTPGLQLGIITPDRQPLVALDMPVGVGYAEWICDIPAGDGFLVSGGHDQYYIVQPGSSSSCLKDTTATYSLASYNTALLQSFTQLPSNRVSDTATLSLNTSYLAHATVLYPTGTFSTITANPALAIASATSSSVSSGTVTIVITTPPEPSHSSSSSHKFKASAIAGGTVAAIATILLTLVVFFCCMRQRRQSQIETIDTLPVERFVSMTAKSHAIYADSPMIGNMPTSNSLRGAAGPSLTHITPFITSKPDDDLSFNPQNSVYADSPMVGNIPAPNSLRNVAGPSLTHITPFVIKPDDSLSLNPQALQSAQSPNAQPNLTTTIGAVSPLQANTVQRDTSTVANAAVPPVLVSVSGTQNDPSNIITALNAFAQLDAAERETLVSTLRNVMTSHSSSGLVREDTIRAPPPYDG